MEQNLFLKLLNRNKKKGLCSLSGAKQNSVLIQCLIQNPPAHFNFISPAAVSLYLILISEFSVCRGFFFGSASFFFIKVWHNRLLWKNTNKNFFKRAFKGPLHTVDFQNVVLERRSPWLISPSRSLLKSNFCSSVFPFFWKQLLLQLCSLLIKTSGSGVTLYCPHLFNLRMSLGNSMLCLEWGLQPHCLLSFTNQVDSGHSFSIKDKPSVPFTTFLFSLSRLCSVQNGFIWALLKIVKFLHLLPTLISSSLPWSISVRPLPKPCRGGGINNHQLLYRTRIPHSVCFFVFFPIHFSLHTVWAHFVSNA